MYILGIDIGGSYIKYGVFKGTTIVLDGSVETPKTDIDALIKALGEIIESTKEYNITKVGMTAPGGVDTERGIISEGGALPYLDGVNMIALMKEQFNVEAAVENDGKAAALAELGFGMLKDKTNGCVMVLGTGVGGGIVINKSLYKGSAYKAGELSFIFSNPDTGRSIGYSGSAVRFIKKAADVLGIEADGRIVFEHLKEGNHPEANAVFEEYCLELGFLIYNIQAVLDVERFVIGGGISQQPLMIEGIKNAFKSIADKLPPSVGLGAFDIVASENANNAVLWGSVYPYLAK